GTGRPPFRGETVAETFHLICSQEPDLAGLDPRLREIVAAALGKDPRTRPTARQLLTRLVGQEQADPRRAAETISATWRGTAPAASPAPESAPETGAQTGPEAGAEAAPEAEPEARRPAPAGTETGPGTGPE